MIKLRPLNLDADYPMITEWWSKRGLPAVPREILPDCGLMASFGGVDLCCGWMYRDIGGKLAVIDWITTNPAAASSRTLHEAVQAVADGLEAQARTLGCKSALSFVAQRTGLESLLAKRGWIDLQGVGHAIMGKPLGA